MSRSFILASIAAHIVAVPTLWFALTWALGPMTLDAGWLCPASMAWVVVYWPVHIVVQALLEA